MAMLYFLKFNIKKIIKTTEEGVQEKKISRKRKTEREKRSRDRKVSRKYINPGSPIPYRKPNPAFFQPVEKREEEEKPEETLEEKLKRVESRLLRPLFTERAQLALAEYNKKNQGAEFKLARLVGGLEEGGCYRFFPWFFHDKPYGWVHHIFFKALPTKDMKTTDDSSAKTFFAELFIGVDPMDVVNACCIVEPDDPGRKLGCGFCAADERHPHPQSGFAAGLVPYVPYYTVDLSDWGEGIVMH